MDPIRIVGVPLLGSIARMEGELNSLYSLGYRLVATMVRGDEAAFVLELRDESDPDCVEFEGALRQVVEV